MRCGSRSFVSQFLIPWVSFFLAVDVQRHCHAFNPNFQTQPFLVQEKYIFLHQTRKTWASTASHVPSFKPRKARLNATPPNKAERESAVNEETAKESSGRAILNLAVPALVSLAIDPLMTLADTAFIGRFAPSTALAGVGSASALLTFSFYLFNFLSISTTPLVSTKRASGDVKGATEMGGQSLSLAIVLGSLLTLVLSFFAQDFLGIIMGNVQSSNLNDAAMLVTDGSKQEAYGYATSFLAIRALAAPAVLICNSAVGILRGFLDTKTPIIILFGANLINFALDYILIPGLGMGSTGAAIATTTAEWISALCFLGVLSGLLPSFAGELGRQQQTKDTNNSSPLIVAPSLSIPPWEEIKPLVLASSSAFFRSAAIQISLSGAAAMAARGGLGFSNINTGNVVGEITTLAASGSTAIAAAAHQIAIQLWLLTSFVCDGLAAASQTLIADALGRKNQADVRDLSKTVLTYAIFLGVALAGILGFGSYVGDEPFLLSFFTSDTEIQQALIPILGWIIVSQPINSLVFTADGILQGASEFTFQAKSVVLSAAIAILSFIGLELFFQDDAIIPGGSSAGSVTSLVHVWEALLILIVMRGLTAWIKMIDQDGPIDIFNKQNSDNL